MAASKDKKPWGTLNEVFLQAGSKYPFGALYAPSGTVMRIEGFNPSSGPHNGRFYGEISGGRHRRWRGGGRSWRLADLSNWKR